ncbi:MAG: SRPBCC family protein [Rubrivivax sp.]|nr:MAG: SRPBCC family protein [Rubrivivax sp.]
MASIHRDISIGAPAAALWDAMRDPAALHTRLVPGFISHCEMEGPGARKIRLVNGIETRELIVTIDDERRRIVWSVRSERLTHHNASTQVFDEDGGGCRVTWIADLQPDAMAPAITAMVEAALQAMKAHAEQVAAAG